MAQAIEHLPNKHKALHSNPSTAKKNVITFLISFSDSLWSVYKMLLIWECWYCSLQFYRICLQVLTILLTHYGFLDIRSHDQQIETTSLLPFLFRNSSTMLNRSSESDHPCLVPDLRRKTLSFPLLRLVIYGLYCMKEHSFIPNLLTVCYILVKCLFSLY
jgi:hypothetical protein